jgi:hypothetical protein
MERAMSAVCVLGMHRSGTSVIARLLNLLGVYLGPDDVIARPGADNLRGHWEHPEFVAINDEILARFGGRWDIPPALPPGWPGDPRLADLRGRATALLATLLAVRPLWGWKDPRTCLTLAFWQDLIGPMRYVHCVRNPRAVAASLAQRNAIELPEAEGLWLHCTRTSLEATAGHPQIFVCYEDVLADGPAALRRLAAFIGHPSRADDSSVRRATDAFLADELCHDRSTTEDLVRDDRISLATKHLYVALRDWSLRQAVPALAAVTSPGDATAGLAHAALASQRDRLAAELLAMRHAFGRARSEADAAGRQLDAINRSRAWRAVSFLLRLTGRGPASRREETATDSGSQ